ncbi:MAG: DUF2330 domain-containing protein [Candidatus Methylumidiphilus sp.]
MKKILVLALAIIALYASIPIKSAMAFCGFYVAKADTKIFNQASKVVLVRDGDRTVLTMANDFKGDPKEFAIVIPVPTFLEKGQIHIGESAIVDHLDAYTSPRLVEYFDRNPCAPNDGMEGLGAVGAYAESARGIRASRERANQLGVKIEAEYTVGEYDIIILSAQESNGLSVWLKENGYKLPQGASEVLGSYIKQKMRFFVAKVNLEEQSKLGFKFLRPLQVAFESPKFMLPIRLGTLNANGDQELFIFTLTKKGRTETTNYRMVKLPEGMDIPGFVKDEFAGFYQAMFTAQVKREDGNAVFLEYAWDMNWCDPCAADPLTQEELKKIGVFWVGAEASAPTPPNWRQPPMPGASEVFVTRLHVRYNRDRFPEDLMFQETADRTNFQGRYVLRHAYQGGDSCPAMETYRREVRDRREKEATTLANLTGWDVNQIRGKMKLEPAGSPNGKKGQWWEKVWE